MCVSACACLSVCAVEEIEAVLVVNLSHSCLSFSNFRFGFSELTLNKHPPGDESGLSFIFQSFALLF